MTLEELSWIQDSRCVGKRPFLIAGSFFVHNRGNTSWKSLWRVLLSTTLLSPSACNYIQWLEARPATMVKLTEISFLFYWFQIIQCQWCWCFDQTPEGGILEAVLSIDIVADIWKESSVRALHLKPVKRTSKRTTKLDQLKTRYRPFSDICFLSSFKRCGARIHRQWPSAAYAKSANFS